MDEKERLVAVEERAKSNTKRIDAHEKDIDELKKTYSIMENMNYRMGNVEQNVKSINDKLDKHEREIKEESNKTDKAKSIKWDKLIDYIFYAVLAYALFKLGLK